MPTYNVLVKRPYVETDAQGNQTPAVYWPIIGTAFPCRKDPKKLTILLDVMPLLTFATDTAWDKQRFGRPEELTLAVRKPKGTITNTGRKPAAPNSPFVDMEQEAQRQQAEQAEVKDDSNDIPF